MPISPYSRPRSLELDYDEPDKWFLWDGEREWRVEGLLSPEQRKYPWRGALTGDLLHKLAAKGWTDASDHP